LKTDSVLEVKDTDSEDIYEPGAFADAALGRCSSPVHSSLGTAESQENMETVNVLQPVVMQPLLPMLAFVTYLPISSASPEQQHFPEQKQIPGEQHCAEPCAEQHFSEARQRNEQTEASQYQSHQQASKQVRNVAQKTTVMLRNVSNNYTRQMLLDLLNSHGFSRYYDFVYLPMDFNRNANLGYAFVNLIDSETAEAFWDIFDGFNQWALPTAKVCEVSWSGPIQGFKAHVDRYKNSPVMHQSVPDEYKPMIFAAGVPQPFPPASKKVRPPQKH